MQQTSKMIKKNIVSIILALIIMYLSLSPSDAYENISLFHIPSVDKLAHFCMYFLFMLTIAVENRKIIKSISRLLLLSLIPISYGICMEILQSVLTESRTGSFSDVLFNSLGILVSIICWLLIRSLNMKKSDSY